MDETIYQVMKTYCPLTNMDGEKLAKNEYPHLLVIGGMNDPRVAYFEPLRFVAKMRNERSRWRKTLGLEPSASDRNILLKIDDAGHGGNSGQYSYLEDLAFEYAFLISSLNAPMKSFNGSVEVGSPQYGYILSPKASITDVSSAPPKPKKRWSIKEKPEGKKAERRGKILKWINALF